MHTRTTCRHKHTHTHTHTHVFSCVHMVCIQAASPDACGARQECSHLGTGVQPPGHMREAARSQERSRPGTSRQRSGARHAGESQCRSPGAERWDRVRLALPGAGARRPGFQFVKRSPKSGSSMKFPWFSTVTVQVRKTHLGCVGSRQPPALSKAGS